MTHTAGGWIPTKTGKVRKVGYIGIWTKTGEGERIAVGFGTMENLLLLLIQMQENNNRSYLKTQIFHGMIHSKHLFNNGEPIGNIRAD